MNNLYGLIMAGGSGTRLWPVSRDYYPKQFLQLFGNKTLIQQTFTRLNNIIPSERIYISTNRIFVDELVAQLEKFGLIKDNIIIQPTDKNTGPAIAWSSKKIYDRNNDAVIINCPSDHLIEPESQFYQAVEFAYQLAQKNLLLTLGIKPTYPNSEYGYITIKKTDFTKNNSQFAYKVDKFVEKPDVSTASSLIKKGGLWNSGIFIWQAKRILAEIKKFTPKIYRALESSNKYFALASSPIDTDILEKSALVWVVPVTFKWKDIGSWKALYEMLPKDMHNNVLNERATILNCNNSLIYGTEGRNVAAINLNDIIVVDTPDSVLVSHKDSVHEIKKVLDQSKQNKPLVTIIVSTYNDQELLNQALQSVLNQSYKNIELIVLDGESTDGTMNIINNYKYKIDNFNVLPTLNHFSRINQGLKTANGEIIGLLGADDMYMDKDVIKYVVEELEKSKADVAWGDLIYIDHKDSTRISMYWKSSDYQNSAFRKGWAPPFATFFARKKVYEDYGVFNTKFEIAADYEFMLRLLEKNKIKSYYIPKILVKMTGKGLTIKSVVDRIKGNLESYLAWKENGLNTNPFILLSKNISKISQFLTSP